MSTARYQHTVIVPDELEQLWRSYQAQRAKPESFNAFINRLIRQEMELRCATNA